ncbi:hypothetical protein ACWEQ7_04225 [Streptomyces sp. NPDC004069]
MSDHGKLASTGAGALVIGATVITGWWILAIAFTAVAIGAVCIRFGFRRGKNAGQQ